MPWWRVESHKVTAPPGHGTKGRRNFLDPVAKSKWQRQTKTIFVSVYPKQGTKPVLRRAVKFLISFSHPAWCWRAHARFSPLFPILYSRLRKRPSIQLPSPPFSPIPPPPPCRMSRRGRSRTDSLSSLPSFSVRPKNCHRKGKTGKEREEEEEDIVYRV